MKTASDQPRREAKAFAPASVANVAVGFDLLGFSANVMGDHVLVEITEDRSVTVHHVSGQLTSIPLDPKRNTATAGLVRLISDRALPYGFRVSIEKGIPLGSGMGGSAASAVAAIVAANALLETPLSVAEMLSYALLGEAQASGSYHADNVAPSLMGGLTLARVLADSSPEDEGGESGRGARPRVDAHHLPVPTGLHCALIHPRLSIRTKEARGILRPDVPLRTHIEQSACLAGFITACFRDDLDLMQKSLRDVVIEPQRAHLIPGFAAVKEAALNAGALGCSISGAGPSVFALTRNAQSALEVRTVMRTEFERHGVRAQSWSFPLNGNGARVVA